MRPRRFIQVDVFTSEPTKGNGLAVVVDGEGLTDVQMQDFATWTNLAETTFLLTPTVSAADYKVRIFTPGREMPFAGHPTLGSCVAWLHAGGAPANQGIVIQECAIGLVEIDVGDSVPAFVAPTTSVVPLPTADIDRLCAALKVDRDDVVKAARLDNGPVWQVLELRSAEHVLAVDSSLVRWPEFVGVSVMGAYPEGASCDYEVRNLSPSSGMSEDPITGSLNAAIAQWMRQDNRLASDLIISQGTKIGREGRVYIRVDPSEADRVLVGGDSKILIDGTLTF